MTIKEYAQTHPHTHITVECVRFNTILYNRVPSIQLIESVIQSQVVISEELYNDYIILRVE